MKTAPLLNTDAGSDGGSEEISERFVVGGRLVKRLSLFTGLVFIVVVVMNLAPNTAETEGSVQDLAAAATRKKGMGGMVGSNYLCSDVQTLGLGDSWYYSWIAFPSGTDKEKCTGQLPIAQEFVPMVHKATSGPRILAALQDTGSNFKQTWIDSNVNYILGYNEPDNSPAHPASIDPAPAAALWHNVQDIADQFNPPLEIIAPSPASEVFDDHGRSWWFDQFFGNCSIIPGCDVDRIKFIGMHDYTGDAALMMQRIEGAYQIYGRKIWLTEYAIIVKGYCARISPDAARHAAYMRETIPLLEASEAVFRYAWFASRQRPNACAGASGLLPFDSAEATLTPLGRIYKNDNPELIVM